MKKKPEKNINPETLKSKRSEIVDLLRSRQRVDRIVITQDLLSEWIKTEVINSRKKRSGYSPSNITQLCKGTKDTPENMARTIDQLELLIREYHNLYKALDRGWRPKNYIDTEIRPNYEYKSMKHHEAIAFVDNRLEVIYNLLPEESSLELSPKVEIDAMGVKLNDVRRSLESFISAEKLNNVSVRILLFDIENSHDLERRITLESGRISTEKRIKGELLTKINDRVNHSWPILVKLVNAYNNTVAAKTKRKSVESLDNEPNFIEKCSVKIKLLKAALTHYIVRVDDHLLVAEYLAKKGTESSYRIFTKREDPKFFQDYVDYFNKLYEEEELSKEHDQTTFLHETDTK